MRSVLTVIIASGLTCAGLLGEEESSSPLDATPIVDHLDRSLAWDCGAARDQLVVGRDGSFSWVIAAEDASWERVDARWSLESSSGVGVTLALEGTRGTKPPGADRPEQTPWTGRVHLAPVRLLPRAGVVRELERWRSTCTSRLEPAALFDAALGVDALALRGDLQGVFHP